MGSLLDEAIIFAVKAHKGMFRKGSNTPYILHPLEAAAIAATMTDNEEVVAAAVLHDVLEDTPVTENQLIEHFGAKVTELVCAESENKREERPAAETWKLRKQETIDSLNSENRISVKMIALGDKLSNVRAMYKDYQVLGDKLWDRFNQKEKPEHGWYYRSIADATTDLSEYPAWQEYNLLVNKLFEQEHNQKGEGEKMLDYKVIFHIDELGKLKLLLDNVSNLLDAIDNKSYHIEVLANGEAVKYYDTTQNIDADIDTLEKLANRSVEFIACNNALRANHIDKDSLLKFVGIVPAGVLELIEKQNEGYAYIRP